MIQISDSFIFEHDGSQFFITIIMFISSLYLCFILMYNWWRFNPDVTNNNAVRVTLLLWDTPLSRYAHFKVKHNVESGSNSNDIVMKNTNSSQLGYALFNIVHWSTYHLLFYLRCSRIVFVFVLLKYKF